MERRNKRVNGEFRTVARKLAAGRDPMKFESLAQEMTNLLEKSIKKQPRRAQHSQKGRMPIN